MVEPDPVLETYQLGRVRVVSGETLKLRGGGGDFDTSSETTGTLDEDDTEDDGSGYLSLRGGARATRARAVKTSAKAKSSDAEYTALGGESSDTEEKWIPLYGYQGVVWFRMDLLYTFVDAVDRLLCLDNRAGVTYSLYFMDKSKRYSTPAERETFLSDLNGNGFTISTSGPGDYSRDRVAWEWLLARFQALGDEDPSTRALFVAGPGDPIPWTWEPNDSHRVKKVVLGWSKVPRMDRRDIAYLRMPWNPADVIYTNQYGPWVANICRVLAAGRIPGRPGYPAIPDAWFSVKGRGRGAKELGTYGGLASLPQLWDAIVSQWEKGKDLPVTLDAKTGPEHDKGGELHITDRWHVFLPGLGRPYAKQFILHEKVGDVKAVRQWITSLVKDSMSAESFAKVHSLQIHLPGAGFLLDSPRPPDVVVSMTEKDADKAFKPVVDRMVHWKVWIEKMPQVAPIGDGLSLFPQFLALRPVFDEYTICDSEQDAEPLDWDDPETTTLSQFRRLVKEVLSGSKSTPPRLKNAWIGIYQGHHAKGKGKSKGPDHAESKPKLLVGPETTETEWKSICKLIVEPDVFISLVDRTSLPRKLKKSSGCLPTNSRQCLGT